MEVHPSSDFCTFLFKQYYAWFAKMVPVTRCYNKQPIMKINKQEPLSLNQVFCLFSRSQGKLWKSMLPIQQCMLTLMFSIRYPFFSPLIFWNKTIHFSIMKIKVVSLSCTELTYNTTTQMIQAFLQYFALTFSWIKKKKTLRGLRELFHSLQIDS